MRVLIIGVEFVGVFMLKGVYLSGEWGRGMVEN